MGSSQSRLKKVSTEYQDYPVGCVPCPQGYKPGNPGCFEDIHARFDDLVPRHFEGARLLRRRQLSKHFKVSHTLAMCPKSVWMPGLIKPEEAEPGYSFNAAYAGPHRVGPRERYPQLEGTMRTNGDLSAKFAHTFGCRTRLRLSTRIHDSRYEELRAALEYRSDDFTISAALAEPKPLKHRGVLLIRYLQALSPRMALGVELACRNVKDGPEANLAGAVRYSTGHRTLSATIGQAGLRLCYHHRQSHQLQMGVEMRSNFASRESDARLVYRLDACVADLVVRGFVDTNWRVGASLEKKLYPIPEAVLLLSGIIDHKTQKVSVGLGLDIG